MIFLGIPSKDYKGISLITVSALDTCDLSDAEALTDSLYLFRIVSSFKNFIGMFGYFKRDLLLLLLNILDILVGAATTARCDVAK